MITDSYIIERIDSLEERIENIEKRIKNIEELVKELIDFKNKIKHIDESSIDSLRNINQ